MTITLSETSTEANMPFGIPIATVYKTHACRYCGQHNCEDRAEHDGLWSANEQTWRMTLVERMACPTCGNSVNDGEHCIRVVHVDVVGVAA